MSRGLENYVVPEYIFQIIKCRWMIIKLILSFAPDKGEFYNIFSGEGKK